jgi:hypothetical protein
MKNPVMLSVIALAIVLCSFSGKKKNSFEGYWSETWGVGQETDVDYHDKYTIAKNTDGTREITCQSSEFYRFIDVKFDKDSLTFKIINTSGMDTLPYYLKLDKKGKKLKGIAYSIRDERTNIEWVREKR